jgi:hypothetical protein
MRKGGYGFHWFYRDIQTYVKNVDVERLREKAGISAPQ